MEYNLYTQLIANNIDATDARKICTVLSGLSIGPEQVKIDGDIITVRSIEADNDLDVYTTMCTINYPKEGNKSITGYHIGKGYFNTNFSLNLDGKFTICVYDRRHKGIFDSHSELWIATNGENVFNKNEDPKAKDLTHFYRYTSEAVSELDGRTKGTNDHFGPYDTISIDEFAKMGINPDSITIMPNNFDQYNYVGNFVADKDFEKEKVQK